MELKVIGTGSKGNAYLLQQGGESILLDAGLKWSEILSAIPGSISQIKGCLLTHEHQDHSKAVYDVAIHGIPVIMSPGTYEYLTEKNARLRLQNRLISLAEGEVIHFSTFTIMPVKALHDAEEPYAFLIRYDPTMETVLYATDTYDLPNAYPNVNHWLVECNYTMDKARTLLEEPEKAPLFERLIRSHMSLERLCKRLAPNDLTRTRTIVLIHISDERGDSDLMQNTVQRVTGIRTIAAYNGMEIKLGSCPF